MTDMAQRIGAGLCPERVPSTGWTTTDGWAPSSCFRPLGEELRTAPGQNVLGVVRFTATAAGPTIRAGYPSVDVHLSPSERTGFAEVWTSPRRAVAGRSRSICYAHDGEFLFGSCRIPEHADQREATEAAYAAALELIDIRGYPHLCRLWHYISGLNHRNGDGLDVYQEFCVGRARALERAGLLADMPAATAIGARGGGIVLYFLACRSGVQVDIDNPRQVPPCRYPSRYSPRSPNFARATYLSDGVGGGQIFVSGTASILGHQTVHTGDVGSQCRVALENIAHLVGDRNLSVHGVAPGRSLRDLGNVKVYVRRAADVPRVRRIISEVLPPSADVVYLHADICRSDLLVEIEGIVASAPRPGVLPSRTVAPAWWGEPEGPRPWKGLPALQQPDWRTHPAYDDVRRTLSVAPPLVAPDEIRTLRTALARVAAGSARVVQAGDCAESFYECTPSHIVSKIGALDGLAARLGARTGLPVLRIGRLGGQFAKPRSQPVEVVDGVELPAFRGHMINAEAPSDEARAHDPRRMLHAYHFSDDVLQALRRRRAATPDLGPWSSHDALVMDYIGSLVRVEESSGSRFLTTTHFPWVGERTGGLGEAHAALLSVVDNPVAAKVGPRSTPETVLGLCALLDPDREPGRLTLIVRMGRDAATRTLPPIVDAVRAAGHPVVWLCDPMHGNTVRLPSGRKTRFVDDLLAEAVAVREVLDASGCHLGGMHLETTADDVRECVGGPIARADELDDHHLILCDPRLTVEQATELIDRVF